MLINGLHVQKAKVRYGCAKALRVIVDEAPALLYPYFDSFAALLCSSNNLFKWEAAYLLARLAGVDRHHKLEEVWEQYFARIIGPGMITAANIIKGGSRIAQSRPDLADSVVTEILRAEHGHYETTECYEIVCGHAFKALAKLVDLVSDPTPLFEFAERHLNSTRPATRKAAETLLEIQGSSQHAAALA